MRNNFNQSFKLQAVEKALNREEGTSLRAIARSLGIGSSTLNNWMSKSRKQTLGDYSNQDILTVNGVPSEKRPQDWSIEEKLDLVIRCGSKDEVEINQLCREPGLYAHHLKQWKAELGNGTMANKQADGGAAENRQLKSENKELRKELRRKEKALAEAAALLILQKKANRLWGYDEDDSQ
jgi:transposase-like protein